MPLLLRYNVRSVFVRWRATLFTVLGIALVVCVYVMVQSLAVGLEKAGASTGDPRNFMIVRRGSAAESGSQISREQAKIIQYQPEIARDSADRPVVSADTIVLVNLPRGGELIGEANVMVRGVSPNGFALRPQVRLVDGRWFESGRREVVVSRRLAGRFSRMRVGDVVKVGLHMLVKDFL